MEYILILPIVISFLITLLVLPSWIRRAKKAELTGKDIHKLKSEKVAEAGGVTVIAGFALGVMVYIAINTFIFEKSSNLIEIFALLSSVLLIGFISFTDDILGWKIGLRRRTRLVLVAFASIPLIAINAGKSTISIPFIGSTELGLVYPILLIPLGIVGATTTYNFLAGYNGLEAGQGIIILSFVAIFSYLAGNTWLSLIVLCMVASLLAFLFFNFYPAKVFPGDSLTYPIGGLIAISSIIGNFERIAVFFFIPYIIETALKSRGGLVKESFSKVNKDGSLELKYGKIYSLAHLSVYIMKKVGIMPTEKKVVYSIWVFQLAICALGVLIFREGIFI